MIRTCLVEPHVTQQSDRPLRHAGRSVRTAAEESYAPSLATVRAEVNKVLDTARIAREMPWTAKEVAFWKTVFPQMTNWLPEEEAAQLRSAFMEEICRLEVASAGNSARVPAASRRKTKSASG